MEVTKSQEKSYGGRDLFLRPAILCCIGLLVASTLGCFPGNPETTWRNYTPKLVERVRPGEDIMTWVVGAKSWSLLYDGISNGEIVFVFREREWLTTYDLEVKKVDEQDLYVHYPYNLGKLITFREIEIKIVSADENGLTFVVMKEPQEMRGVLWKR